MLLVHINYVPSTEVTTNAVSVSAQMAPSTTIMLNATANVSILSYKLRIWDDVISYRLVAAFHCAGSPNAVDIVSFKVQILR